MSPRFRYSLWAFAMAVALLVAAGFVGLLPGRSASTATDLVAERKAAGIAECPPSSDASAVAGGLPDVTLACLGGGASVRVAGLRGPMLIVFWAQWCESCREDAPYVSAFARTQAKVAVLGINYADPQTSLAIESARAEGATYPHLSDPKGKLKGPLGIPGVPYALLIDSGGKIAGKRAGPFFSSQELQAWVAQEMPS